MKQTKDMPIKNMTQIKMDKMESVFKNRCCCLKNAITNEVISKCENCKKKEAEARP